MYIHTREELIYQLFKVNNRKSHEYFYDSLYTHNATLIILILIEGVTNSRNIEVHAISIN